MVKSTKLVVSLVGIIGLVIFCSISTLRDLALGKSESKSAVKLSIASGETPLGSIGKRT